MIEYVPQQSLDGIKPFPVPRVSVAGTIPLGLVPFAALLAEPRFFSEEAKSREEMTYPTGGGSTNWDGKESSDGPFEDDEKK